MSCLCPPQFGAPELYFLALSALRQGRCPGSGLRRSAKYWTPSLDFLFFPDALAQAKDSQSVRGMCPVGGLGNWPHVQTESAFSTGERSKRPGEPMLPLDREGPTHTDAHSCGWLWSSREEPHLWSGFPSFKGHGLKPLFCHLTHKPAPGGKSCPTTLFPALARKHLGMKRKQ